MAHFDPQHFVGNSSLFRFRVVDQDRAPVDLSSAIEIDMLFEDPNGTTTSESGTLTTDGTDGRYEFQAPALTFLATAGTWRRQGHVKIGSLEYWTEIVEFIVHDKLTP